jgi:hypothetical protein
MKRRNGLIVAAAAGAGALVGILILTSTVATGAPVPSYPRNGKGQTYGSAVDAPSLQEEPDLILVMMADGRQGYVLRTDLEGPLPKNPAEAVAMQQSAGNAPRSVRVYAVDGTTQLGSFAVGK